MGQRFDISQTLKWSLRTMFLRHIMPRRLTRTLGLHSPIVTPSASGESYTFPPLRIASRTFASSARYFS